jgi:general secretion pathway protein A
MYLDYFGLTENPFTITPDPRYLFMSTRHQEALAHLLYGLKEGGGFVQLTGEVGTGKTTLTRALLEQLPENVDVALVLNPKLTAFEFVATICDDLNISYPREADSIKTLIDALNEYLFVAHSSGRRVVLIVDEAQNFRIDVLEQIRLLTNLETTRQKLLQIILVGQPELRELLSKPELRQLAQRVTARYHLVPMTREEVAGYVKHRLKVAGARQPLFSDKAIQTVHKLSGGVPRLVNIICDRALLGAYAKEVGRVTPEIVRKAAYEVTGDLELSGETRRFPWLQVAVVAGLLVSGVWLWQETGLYEAVKQRLISASRVAAVTIDTSEPLPLESETLISQTPDDDAHEEPLAAEGQPETIAAAPEMSSTEESSDEFLVKTAVNATPDTAASLYQQVASAEQFKALLDETPSVADLDLAFNRLFARWGLDYGDLQGVTGCERALSERLRCMWSRGTLDELLSLNRPALMWLEDGDQKSRRYVLIVGLMDDQVVLDIGDNRYQVPRSLVQALWSGKFLLLWRPPAMNVELIRPGSRGELVVWLRRNLEKVQGETVAAGEVDYFDENLMQQVKLFQNSRALKADGLVGEQTLIHLNTVGGDDSIPLLTGFQPQDGD